MEHPFIMPSKQKDCNMDSALNRLKELKRVRKFIKSRSSDATIEGLSDATIFSLERLLNANKDLTVTSGHRDTNLPKK